MGQRPLSSARILLRGWVMVNVPVTVLILFAFFGLSAWGVPYWPALLGGTAAGWVYWAWAVRHWIRWSYRNGKPGLLVWNLEMVKRVLGSSDEGDGEQ